MTLIIVPREEEDLFEVTHLRTVLARAQNVEPLSPGQSPTMQLQFDWSYNLEPCFARLQRSGEAIHIEPLNKSATDLVTAIRDEVPFAIDLIDDQFTFHVPVKQLQSSEELFDAINRLSTDEPPLAQE